MKKKRFLSMLLAALLAALLPASAVTAYAAPATTVYVNGVELDGTPGKTYWKNGDTATATGTENDWNAKFESGTGTLTLKNARITQGGEKGDYGILAKGDLAVVLEGKNSIESVSMGIYIDADGGDLTIDGSGSLEITDAQVGINPNDGGKTTINGGEVTIKATSSPPFAYQGALHLTAGSLTISGYFMGIVAEEGDVSIMGGTLTLKNCEIYGIYCNNFSLTDGTANISAGGYGVSLMGGFTINSGYAKLTGGPAAVAQFSAANENPFVIADGMPVTPANAVPKSVEYEKESPSPWCWSYAVGDFEYDG